MSWTTESYFSKAQAYWARATSRDRSDEQFLLNVCFTIEFITRGALCFANPALNAAADHESLLYACGQVPRSQVKTVEFNEALKRLQRFIPGITESEIAKIRTLMDARNGELHGDQAELSNIPADSLLPSFYSFIVKVCGFCNESLSSLLGEEDARGAKHIADAMTKDRSKRVGDLIRVCKERFFSLSPEEQGAKRTSTDTNVISAVLTSGHHVLYLKCPACAQQGNLLAAPVGRSAPLLRGDELVQEVRIVPTQFQCKCCSLNIHGLDELMAAGFQHEYRSFDDVDPIDHFKIDPLDYVDPADIVREHYRSEHEYQDE